MGVTGRDGMGVTGRDGMGVELEVAELEVAELEGGLACIS
jgi:hypothetical protein